MRRDLDVVRQLLELFEKELPGHPVRQIAGEFGIPAIKVCEHIALMCEAGLLEGNCQPITGRIYVKRITWAGHDFLDAARNEDVWQKTKEKAKAAGSWTFALILEILKTEAAKRISGLIS
ncbi:MAG TPA: hypothetical protein DIT64_20455 [Verrucomicrobiales bacterium]|nr:hypothetical protein [Verrucomicrobiales bacterium]